MKGIVRILCLATVVTGLLGCAATVPVSEQAGDKFSDSELRQLFPLGDYHRRTATVTKRQAEDINRLMGYAAVKDGEVFSYVNVHPFPRHRGVIEHLLDEKAGPLTLLVAIKLDQVKGVAAKGKGADIPGLQDFLGQFVDRTAESSFEIATVPDDLLTTPTKLLGLKDNLVLSQKIAKAVKKALVVHKVMGL